MKITIPADDKTVQSKVSQTFGRARYFIIYNTEAKTSRCIENKAASSQGGAGIKAAQIVADNGGEVLITPQCGQNAADVLQEANIKVYKSIEGTVEQNITDFTAGRLAVINGFHEGYHGGK
ncbi:NifB/NifX family molybdenum-iron cluster-binding protein [Pectinatus sottacetonis]|uniref:NifB/NifX family molybdenum-iron cluster-binding protein n=1 Tax=Pectinatus sottacetonis TaxID=1002795 RepID=UPI0018C77550